MKNNYTITIQQIIIILVLLPLVTIAFNRPFESVSSTQRVVEYNSTSDAMEESIRNVGFSFFYAESQSRLLESQMEARFYRIIHSRAFEAEAFFGVVQSLAEEWNDDIDGQIPPMELNMPLFAAYYTHHVVGQDFLSTLSN